MPPLTIKYVWGFLLFQFLKTKSCINVKQNLPFPSIAFVSVVLTTAAAAVATVDDDDIDVVVVEVDDVVDENDGVKTCESLVFVIAIAIVVNVVVILDTAVLFNEVAAVASVSRRFFLGSLQ